MKNSPTEERVVEKFIEQFMTPEDALILEGVSKVVWLKRQPDDAPASPETDASGMLTTE